MKLFCLDTSSGVLSIAIAENNNVLVSQNRNLGRNLSKSIVPYIEKAFAKSSLKLSDMDAFCIGIGPGSFTGLRVGVATIKALAYALNKPVLTVSSLDLIAMNVKASTKPIFVIQDARREMVYYAVYERQANGLKIIQRPQLVLWADLCNKIPGPSIIIGDGTQFIAKDYRERLAEAGCLFYDKGKQWIAQAKYMPVLVQGKLIQKKFENVYHLTPMYLHPEDCQVRKG